MSLIGDPSFVIANSKIRRNHSIGPGNLTSWQPPPPAKSEEEHRESEYAWARFKEALAAGIIVADEDAIREAGFPNWRDYWGAALAWDMSITDFVFLIETHALTPERIAMEIKGTAVPFAIFLMKGLDEALQSREPWIYEETKAEKCRVRPREAAMWLNRRLGGQARLPDTLREYLAAAPGDEASTGSVSRKAPTARPRGPRPEKLQRVIRDMRASDQCFRLVDMKGIEMESLFKASRYTCDNARKTILSENNSNNLQPTPNANK
jgi:hypothetical protein